MRPTPPTTSDGVDEEVFEPLQADWSADKCIKKVATWFAHVTKDAQLLPPSSGNGIHACIQGLIYLYNLRKHGADLTYMQRDWDLWILLWLTKVDRTEPRAMNMRTYFQNSEDSGLCSRLRSAKATDTLRILLGMRANHIIVPGLLQQAWQSQTYEALRIQFERDIADHARRTEYASTRDLLEATYPYTPDTNISKHGTAGETHQGLPLIPEFFRTSNRTGEDLEPLYNKNGHRLAGSPMRWHICVMMTETGRSTNTQFAILDKRRELRACLSANSQLPGVTVTCRLTGHIKSYEIILAPDSCDTFDITVADSNDHQAVSDLTKKWSDFQIRQMNRPLSLVEISCTFKQGQGVPVIHQGADPEAEPSAATIGNSSWIKLLIIMDKAVDLHLAKAVRTALALRDTTPGGINAAFPLYRRSYPEYDQRHSLAQIMAQGWSVGKTPSVPVHLYRTHKHNDGKFTDLPSPSVGSLSSGRPYETMVIGDWRLLIDTMCLGLLRDMQYETSKYETFNKMYHYACFQWDNAEDPSNDFVYVWFFLDDRMESTNLPPEDTEIGFTVTFAESKEGPEIDSRQCSTVEWSGPIIHATASDGRPWMITQPPALLSEAWETQLGRENGDDSINREIKLRLTPYHGLRERQLKALLELQRTEPEPGKFHLSRMLLQQRDKATYSVNLAANFATAVVDRKGAEITDRDRDTRLQAIDAFSGLLDGNEQQQNFAHACLNDMPEGTLVLYGPAGTGKSLVLGIAIWQSFLADSDGIAAAAKTNKAVDSLVGKVVSLGHCAPNGLQPVMIRLHTQTVEKFLRTKGVWDSKPSEKAIINEHLSLARVTRAAAKTCSNDAPLELRTLRSALEYAEDCVNQGFRPSRADKDDFVRIAKTAEAYMLSTADMIFATVDTLGFALQKLKVKAQTVMFDEVSLTTVTETIVGLAFNEKCERVILAGDPAQMSPISQSHGSGMNEVGSIYSASLFGQASCVTLLPEQQHHLTMNYRNRQLVLDLVNTIGYRQNPLRPANAMQTSAYDLKLNTAKSNPSFARGRFLSWDFTAKPLSFMHVAGPAETRCGNNDDGSLNFEWLGSNDQGLNFQMPSRTQRRHVSGQNAVIEMLQSFSQAGIDCRDISVITAYKWDSEDMAKKMGDMGLKSDAYTIDKYQGTENVMTFVLFATFEGKVLPFIGHLARLIVALTRAKEQVVLVGDFNELTTSCQQRPNEAGALLEIREFLLEKNLLLDWDPNHPANRMSLRGRDERMNRSLVSRTAEKRSAERPAQCSDAKSRKVNIDEDMYG